MKTLHLTAPRSWNELTQKQLRHIFRLMESNHDATQVKLLALLRWNKIKIIGRNPSGDYLFTHNRRLHSASVEAFAAAAHALDWLDSLPAYPVRLEKIGRLIKHKALPADFLGVPFATFLTADNIYQHYLAENKPETLTELARILYSADVNPTPAEAASVFYWFASLKSLFAKRWPHFFKTAPVGQNSGISAKSLPRILQDSVDAQLRAVTRGDTTKEEAVLRLDTWRVMAELNALAREAEELEKIKSK